MRFIVKDYILQLKEKDELDILICNLFTQKGYHTDTLPKTGNRQYGVDIKMHDRKELLLFVVKQGNISRDIWDGNKNAVRQSLNEIEDYVLPKLTTEERQKNVTVYVVSNGTLDQSVEMNFRGYAKNFNERNTADAVIKYMGVDDLVADVLSLYFNEYLFDESMRRDLRKALYFIGESDYKRIYYESIIDHIIEKVGEEKTGTKKQNKIFNTLYLVSQMICAYAHEEGCEKIAIALSEYTLIRIWYFIKEHNSYKNKVLSEWLIKFCKRYEVWNEEYFKKVKQLSSGEAKLPFYGVVEERCMLYEVLWYSLAYTWYLEYYYPAKASQYLNIIVELMNRYRFFLYLPFDNHVAVMILFYRLLEKHHRTDEISNLMEEQAYTQVQQFRLLHKFPAPSDSYEEAAKIEEGTYDIPYKVSGFWGYYLLLIAKYNDAKLYGYLLSFLKDELEDVSKCVWFCRREDEDLLYQPNAMQKAGVGVEIRPADKYDVFYGEVTALFQTYRQESFSFDENGFEAMEMILCRYFGYIPRVVVPEV